MKNIMSFISFPGGTEWIVILVIALLIFGRRLPEVARSLGSSLQEFKKGIKETREEVDTAAQAIEEDADPGKSSRLI